MVSDAIGNITGYAGWTYAWQAGRQLALDTVKRWGSNRGTNAVPTIDCIMAYPSFGRSPAASRLHSRRFPTASLLLHHDAILDSAGNTVVQYAYDAWR